MEIAPPSTPSSSARGRGRRTGEGGPAGGGVTPGVRRGLSFIQRGVRLPADVDAGLRAQIADPDDDGALWLGVFDHELDPKRVAVLEV